MMLVGKSFRIVSQTAGMRQVSGGMVMGENEVESSRWLDGVQVCLAGLRLVDTSPWDLLARLESLRLYQAGPNIRCGEPL